MSKKLVTALMCSAFVATALPAAAQDTEDPEMLRDLAVVQKPIYELGTGGGPRLRVKAWVDKPKRVYTVGQNLQVSVEPSDDAYITVLNVGSSGRMTILFPNHFQKESKVKAGQTVTIPSTKARWSIQVGGPAGIDLVKVIASREPLTLEALSKLAKTTDKSPVIAIERSADETARDLSVQLKPPAAAQKPSFGVANILVRIRPREAN